MPWVVLLLCILALVELLLIVHYDIVDIYLINHGFKEQNPKDRKDYRCLKGWENTLAKMNYKADVCFFGNSIIADANFQEDFPNLKIVNLGYSGDDLNGMIVRHKMIFEVHPTKIFLMAGINDLSKRRENIENIIVKYSMLLDSINKYNPNSEIYLFSILPINHKMKNTSVTKDRIIKTNNEIKNIALKRSITYIDLYSLFVGEDNNMEEKYTYDGIHLNRNGYDIWNNVLKSHLFD